MNTESSFNKAVLHTSEGAVHVVSSVLAEIYLIYFAKICYIHVVSLLQCQDVYIGM